MYGGYCSALVTSFLLLVAASFVPTAHSSTPTESCVDQSGIICSSLHLHGSSYYHKLDTAITTNGSQLDMIHCELSSQRYILHLDHEDGIKSLIASGSCIISDDINCTRVILYVNLTYYDQRNGSIIPVCAIRLSDHNAECFCIRYLTLGSTPDNCNSCTERCKPEINENATTTKPEPDTDHQTQTGPTNGCPAVAGAAGRYPAATFQGTISVLIIVIVILSVVIAILILVIIYLRKKPTSSLRPSTKAKTTAKYSPSQTDASHRIHADDGECETMGDDGDENDGHDIFSEHEERRELL